MMVRPELPYSPGMEVMGIVDACGEGAGGLAGQARRRDDEGRPRRVRRVRDLPGRLGVRDARVDPASRCGRAVLPVPPRVAGPLRPRRAAGGRERADPCRGRRIGIGRDPTRQARRRDRCSRRRAPTRRSRCAASSVPTSPSTTPTPTSPRSCSRKPNDRGVDVVFDNVGEAVMEASMKCTAYNGRYLMMGFASNKEVADEPFIVPRRIALGNFKLCGVLLAYAQPDMAHLVKTAMGWNFAVAINSASRSWREIITACLAGDIKTVVGSVVEFDDVTGSDRSDGQPRDDRPHHREGRLARLIASPTQTGSCGAPAPRGSPRSGAACRRSRAELAPLPRARACLRG